jgi:hypothetical protein
MKLSLDGLRRVLEKYTGVPAGAQILMTSFGTQVKQDMVKDVVQATGKVSSYKFSDTVVCAQF